MARILQQGLPLLGADFVFDVGHQSHRRYMPLAQLTIDFKRPDVIDFISKEFNTVWVAMGKRVHIYDASTYGELSGLFYKVNPFKPHVEEAFVEEFQI